MHRLHTHRAIPHPLESALLLCRSVRALEAEASAAWPAERPGGIAKGEASVVEEAKSHTRRHIDGIRGMWCDRSAGVEVWGERKR